MMQAKNRQEVSLQESMHPSVEKDENEMLHVTRDKETHLVSSLALL